LTYPLLCISISLATAEGEKKLLKVTLKHYPADMPFLDPFLLFTGSSQTQRYYSRLLDSECPPARLPALLLASMTFYSSGGHVKQSIDVEKEEA
jgi:hypothetical protein